MVLNNFVLKMKFLLILCEVLILGFAHLTTAQLSDKFFIKHLVPPEGPGYDLFYYDGVSLRDEKWRFDYANHDTAVHRRFGLKSDRSSQFHVTDTLSDANGFRQKTRILSDPGSIERLLAMGIEPPTTLHNSHKLRDNSNREGQPRDSTLGLLNGVTVGVTLNEPMTPGDSYINGFVQTGLGSQNNIPPLQFGIPNLGILSGSRPTNEAAVQNKPSFGFPFFGNNGAAGQISQPPPPPQNLPGIFGLPFGNREPVPPPPPIPGPQQQTSFLGSLQNLQIPFIGQPQTMTSATTESTPATNPSLFGNFPSFGFQNNNKPITTTTATTSASQGPFSNLQLPFANFGQSTTTTPPEATTVTTQRPFGFNLPNISGIFQNNNGKGVNKKINNRVGPPGHDHGHSHPPNHPKNRPSNHSPNHPHRPSKPFEASSGENEIQNINTTVVPLSAPEDVTEKILEEATPTVENLVTDEPNETGLLQTNAAEPSADQHIQKTLVEIVEPLVPVVDKNSYAFGIQETSSHSLSNVEPIKSSSISPNAASTVSENPFPNKPNHQFQYIFEQSTTLATSTENGETKIDEDQNNNQIVSEINSLSDNPPFPTLASDLTEPKSQLSGVFPVPLVHLAPPFETEPGVLGIHEDLVLSKIKNASISNVPGIIELIRQSQGNRSGENRTQADEQVIELRLLDHDLPEPAIELKSAEIIRINSLEQTNNVMLPETDILPPFESDYDAVPMTTTNYTPTRVIEISNNIILPETDLLPPFEASPDRSQIQNIPSTTPHTTTPNPVTPPETDLLPPIESVNQRDPLTTTTPHTTATLEIIKEEVDITVTSAPSITQNNIMPPGIDLLPPIELKLSENAIQNTIPIQKLKTTTTAQSTSTPQPAMTPLVSVIPNNVTIPEKDLLPPFESNNQERLLTVTAPHTTTTSQSNNEEADFTVSSKPIIPNNNMLPGIDLLPPFEKTTPSNNTTTNILKTTTTTPRTTPTLQPTTTPNNVTLPETDLLPPLESINQEEDQQTTTTPHTTSASQQSKGETGFTVSSAPAILNKIITPGNDLLPPFESGPFTTKNQNTLPDIEITSTTTAKPSTITFKPEMTVKVPETDLASRFKAKEVLVTMRTPYTTTTSLRSTSVTISNNIIIPPGTDLLPPFESSSHTGKVTVTTPQTTISTATPSTVTIKPEPTVSSASLSKNTVASRLVTVQNNIQSPEIDLLPPFKSDRADLPTTSTTLKTPIVVSNNVNLPEIDLLPPFESSSITVIGAQVQSRSSTTIPETTTLVTIPRTNTTTTTPHISSIEVNKLTPPNKDLAPPFKNGSAVDIGQTKPHTLNVTSVAVPDIDLLPPFERTTDSNIILPQTTTTNRPKTSTTTTTTSKAKLTTTPPTSVPLIDIALPASDLLPPLHEKTVTSNRSQGNSTTTTRLATKLPEVNLLPPLQNSGTSASTRSSTAPLTATTQMKPKPVTTTTPRIVTDKKVQPIYQRITTNVTPPAVDLLPPHQSNNDKLTTTIATTKVESRFTGKPVSENIVVPGINLLSPFEQRQNKTKFVVDKTVTTTTTTSPPTTSRTTIPTTTAASVKIKIPSKLFLPPFESPIYKLDLNTNTVKRMKPLVDSAIVKTANQLDQTTIRGEIDKIVGNVRKIIEHTSESDLPSRQMTSRPKRDPAIRSNPYHPKFDDFGRTASRNNDRDHKHKFNSHRPQHFYHPRHPDQNLRPPQKLKPGQLDVFDLDKHITQDGHSLDGPIFYTLMPDHNQVPSIQPDVSASPAVPSPIPDDIETTTEAFPIFPAPENELTTKPAIVIKRPVFVNLDDEPEDTETTTSILDIRLSPNAIKSLIDESTTMIPATTITTTTTIITTTTQVSASSVNDTSTTKAPFKRPVFVNFDDDESLESSTNMDEDLDTRFDPNAIKSLIG